MEVRLPSVWGADILWQGGRGQSSTGAARSCQGRGDLKADADFVTEFRSQVKLHHPVPEANPRWLQQHPPLPKFPCRP